MGFVTKIFDHFGWLRDDKKTDLFQKGLRQLHVCFIPETFSLFFYKNLPIIITLTNTVQFYIKHFKGYIYLLVPSPLVSGGALKSADTDDITTVKTKIAHNRSAI